MAQGVLVCTLGGLPATRVMLRLASQRLHDQFYTAASLLIMSDI